MCERAGISATTHATFQFRFVDIRATRRAGRRRSGRLGEERRAAVIPRCSTAELTATDDAHRPSDRLRGRATAPGGHMAYEGRQEDGVATTIRNHAACSPAAERERASSDSGAASRPDAPGSDRPPARARVLPTRNLLPNGAAASPLRQVPLACPLAAQRR